jgi:transposase
LATRARIVLWHAQGRARKEIGPLAGVSLPTADRWVRRYRGHGLAGLQERKPGGPRAQVPSQVRSRILALSRTTPPRDTGLSHWSCQLLADYLARTEGITVSWHYIAKPWRAEGLQPHRSSTYKAGRDPAFAAKVADVVGLYLDPPGGAVVLPIDEKTQIQALDRTQPLFPPDTRVPHGPVRRTHAGGAPGGGWVVCAECVSVDAADFCGTILYAGRRNHPRHGRVEVFGYQNTAMNLAAGPNAMLLHLPARHVTSRQFLEVGRARSVLRNMADALTPASAGRALNDDVNAMTVDARVEVFEHDIYTIVLAQSAAHIPQALARVPPHKRPALNPQLFAFNTDLFPQHTIALCCFDNALAAQAKPLLWYEPADRDRLVLPAIDCHTGAVPDLRALVEPDHWVIFGSDHAPDGWGQPVTYGKDARRQLREFLPTRVTGAYFAGTPLPNGDFAITHDDLLRGNLDRIERIRPSH